MANDLILEIVTPEKLAFSDGVQEVTLPGTEGEFGVLLGHAALLSSIDIGELSFIKDSKKIFYAVNTGYAEVTGNKVTVLVETAERSDLIDKERAVRAKENAESKMAKLSKDEAEFELAKTSLLRAVTRIGVSEKQ
jgi:F-type H+-transporting ATPase subunit epsilon